MSYELRILPSAEKDLRKLPRSTVSAIWNKIESLSQAAFPSGVRKLEGADRLWRLRVRDYRITYEVDSGMKEITIRYVRHRREAYQQL